MYNECFIMDARRRSVFWRSLWGSVVFMGYTGLNQTLQTQTRSLALTEELLTDDVRSSFHTFRIVSFFYMYFGVFSDSEWIRIVAKCSPLASPCGFVWYGRLTCAYLLNLPYQGATSVLECRCPVEFSSNPNQKHLNKLIKVFRITRATSRWVFFQGWS